MRAVVTGASGFLGVSIVNTLLERNYEVLAVVRPASANISRLPETERLSCIELDISEISELPKYSFGKFDAFYHLAWSGIRGKDRDNADLQEINYINSISALNAAKNMGCKTFVSSGSQAECGLTDEIITEKTPLNPVCEYGKAKVKTLTYAENFCEVMGIKLIWARIFSLYGIFDYEKSLINYALNMMLENKPVRLSECTQLWDFMNVRDAADAVISAAESELNGIVNIASGSPKPLKEFILEMKQILDSDSELLFGAIPASGKGTVSLRPDISLLEKCVGFTSKIDFESGIRELAAVKLKGN